MEIYRKISIQKWLLKSPVKWEISKIIMKLVAIDKIREKKIISEVNMILWSSVKGNSIDRLEDVCRVCYGVNAMYATLTHDEWHSLWSKVRCSNDMEIACMPFLCCRRSTANDGKVWFQVKATQFHWSKNQ